MTQQQEQQIAVTGSLFSISLFEQKLMKNFLIINNKIRKLQNLFEVQQKQKAIQKQFKFLAMKVDTIVQKLPKQGGSITRSDVKPLIKQQLVQLFNSNDEKILKSKFNTDLISQINRIKQDISKGNFNVSKESANKKEGVKTSFTAAQVLRQNQKQSQKSIPKLSKDSLQEILNNQQLQIVQNVINEKKEGQNELNINDLSSKIQQLQKTVDQLKLGRGYATFLQREAQKFQRFEQYEQKSRQTARKIKQKPIQLQGIKTENVKSELIKSGLMSQLQRMEYNKDQIAKHQLMQKKTLFNTKGFKQTSRQYKDAKDLKQLNPVRQSKQGFQRSKSIRKLDKLQKRLRVEDQKDLNGVLRQIQLRIQSKVSNDIFMGFIKDFEQKLQILKITKDSSMDINQIRKNIFVIQSKLQSIIVYLQSASQQEQALIVKKQWTCVSCDKGLQKYNGKVGSHLNWDSIASKKISPTKTGAFGQTGQLAAKIKNLIEGDQGQ